MAIRNKQLFQIFQLYVQGICENSLNWRPHSRQYKMFIDSLVVQDLIITNVKKWNNNNGEPPEETIAEWVRDFTKAYQEKIGKLVWDEKIFIETYEIFECFLLADKLIQTFVIPIYSFKCEINKLLNFANNVQLVPKGYDSNVIQMQRIVKRFSSGSQFEWFIRYQVNIDKSLFNIYEDNHINKVREHIGNFITCLRIIHAGLIFFDPIYIDGASPFGRIDDAFSTLSSPFFIGEPNLYSHFRDKYVLEISDLNILRRLYNQISKLNDLDKKFISMAISRFNDSYNRINHNDKVVDYCVSLESIYVRENDELSYKLALRCANFLGKTSMEKTNIFINLKQAYNFRSQVVHGNIRNSSETEVLELEEIVRKSIRKLIINDSLIRKIREKPAKGNMSFLDEIILAKPTTKHNI